MVLPLTFFVVVARAILRAATLPPSLKVFTRALRLLYLL